MKYIACKTWRDAVDDAHRACFKAARFNQAARYADKQDEASIPATTEIDRYQQVFDENDAKMKRIQEATGRLKKITEEVHQQGADWRNLQSSQSRAEEAIKQLAHFNAQENDSTLSAMSIYEHSDAVSDVGASEDKVNLIKMFQADSLQKAVADAMAGAEAEWHALLALRAQLKSRIYRFRVNLAGDWRIDDEGVIRIAHSPAAYRAELLSKDTVIDSANVSKVSESIAWAAVFQNLTIRFIPISDHVLNVSIDFGHGNVEMCRADRIYLDAARGRIQQS